MNLGFCIVPIGVGANAGEPQALALCPKAIERGWLEAKPEQAARNFTRHNLVLFVAAPGARVIGARRK